jgi:hypothetical protein
MKQGRTEKVVFAKLSKVELGVVDDIRDAISRGQKIENTLGSELKKYNGLLRAANQFNKHYNDLLSKAKEIGVEPPAELKKLQAIADGFEKKGQALKKVANLF